MDYLGRIVEQQRHPHFLKVTHHHFYIPVAGFYVVLLENEKGEQAGYKLVVD